MNTILTYIINLKTSNARRTYMEDIMSPYAHLEVHFIEAIDGRTFSESDLKRLFDYDQCMLHQGRNLNKGEIGCVLSHRKAMQHLLNSSSEYALILEDDVTIIRDLSALQEYNIDCILSNDRPTILLLSGDFWYFKKSDVVTCYDAIGAYAYLINRSAAKLILATGKPFTVADDWFVFKRMGLNIKAVKPYMVDANLNMDQLSSDVNQEHWGFDRRHMSRIKAICSYFPAVIKRLLKCFGHYESKYHVLYGKVIGK